MERAPRVCATCKARKKGCDKILPRCGYCTQRHLVCIYDDAPDPRRTPGDSWSAASVGSSPPNLFLHSLPSHTQMPLDGVLHTHVSHVLHISQLPLAEVSGRYFDSFHHWLPVISRELLHGVSSMHGDGYPPADYSLLLLALCLVTLNPSDDITTQAMSPQTLYLEVRMLFTQVQAMINTSTRLVQTGLLLAAYEYASGNPHAAYISIGTCARIASVLGIDKSGWKYERSESDLTSALHSFECQNIWWGMIVLERLVLYECPDDHLHPTLDFPSLDTELPVDLNSIQSIPLSPSHEMIPTVGDTLSSNVSRFGRQVQAVALLVQVEQITSDTAHLDLSELRKMDEKLRGFLTILMSQSPQGHQCGANGVIIRSLVRLHRYILNHQFVANLPDTEIHQQSHAALDTLARMMVEVAHDHLARFVPGQVDSLPLTCSYNMHSMMGLIQDRWDSINSQNTPQDLEAFLALYQAVRKRWRPSSEH